MNKKQLRALDEYQDLEIRTIFSTLTSLKHSFKLYIMLHILHNLTILYLYHRQNFLPIFCTWVRTRVAYNLIIMKIIKFSWNIFRWSDNKAVQFNSCTITQLYSYKVVQLYSYTPVIVYLSRRLKGRDNFISANFLVTLFPVPLYSQRPTITALAWPLLICLIEKQTWKPFEEGEPPTFYTLFDVMILFLY